MIGEEVGALISHGADISGGAVAVPAREVIGLIGEAIHDIGTVAVEGVSSTSAAVGFAAAPDFGALMDARSNNGNGNGGNKVKNTAIDNKQERVVKREAFQPLTNKEARKLAKELGYIEGKPDFNTHGEPVFKHPKRNSWISPDQDGHKGGMWKEFDNKGKRLWTLDKYGNRIAE